MKNVFSLKRRRFLSEQQLKQKILEALPNIRRYAYSLTANPADADDLLQSLVERLLKGSIPCDVNAMAWMLKVCRNMWIDETRKFQVKTNYVREVQDNSESNMQPDENIQVNIDPAKLQNAIGELPIPQREVLSLVVLSGMSYAQTAEIMGVPIGTVMSRIARARQTLIQHFDSTAGENNGH